MYTMKKKIFTFLISAIMISVNASSQTIKENLDKLAKDRSTRDKADKADVLMQKKSISDSVQTKTMPVKAVSKAHGVNRVKHKKHKHKLKLKKAPK